MSNYNSIKKTEGVTPAEKYLGRLCLQTFLSLWSYPSIYRIEKDRQKKEVCDLLVIFGNHILIFSDKHCRIQESNNVTIDWQRWFKRAIVKSALQTWGAERWIKDNPTNLYINPECTQLLPLDMPNMNEAKFHLVVIAHGVSGRIQKLFGGSGSLIIQSDLKGFEQHTEPFMVGDLDPGRTFVHVLDDDSLNTVMHTRDTISDFVAYLEKRAILLRSQRKIFATGEEELLTIYLKNLNENREHDFVFPIKVGERINGIALVEGHWDEFQKNPQRVAQLEEDKISYMWDALIEKFNHYALEGEQYFVSAGGLKDSEKILRFMARESRFKRRYFAQSLKEMLETTPENQRRLRVIPPMTKGDPYYVLLLFPIPKSFHVSQDDYRTVRQRFLEASCMVVKLKYPDAEDIVGIATETGWKNVGRSEDAVYLDASHWSDELEKEARVLQEELGILKEPQYKKFHVREYPDVELKNTGAKPD